MPVGFVVVLRFQNYASMNGHRVVFDAGTGGALPGGISGDVPYEVENRTEKTFKLKAVGGSTVNITSAGTLPFFGRPLEFGVAIAAQGLVSISSSAFSGSKMRVRAIPSTPANTYAGLVDVLLAFRSLG